MVQRDARYWTLNVIATILTGGLWLPIWAILLVAETRRGRIGILICTAILTVIITTRVVQ
jgi:hypothetical protein